MELIGLNESPPTGVLNNMNKTNLNTTLNNKVSNLNSTANNTNLNSLNAAVFTNLSNSNNCELNNSNLGLSTSSFSLALNNQQANKFSTTPNSLNSNNLNNLNCSLNSKNNLSPLNSTTTAKQQTDFLNQTDNLQNYLNNCDIKLGDLNKQSDFINSLNSHNNQQKSSSSNSSNCVNLNTNNNNLTNSNLISTNNSSPNLFCAQQQLFNQQTTNNSQQQFNLQQQLNNQQKVKRTRQRVDAGEPRNSYASIANYASNRLVGKTSSKQFQTFQKGLFDQYLGNLNNLLASNGQFNLDDFLLSTNSTNQLINNQSINNLLANLTNDKNFNQLEINQFNQFNQQKLNNQMILNQSFNNWNTNSAQQSDLKLTNSAGANNLESQQQQQQQQQNLDQQTTMAKSRFSEDAVSLDYNVKVSKHSEFLDNNTEPIDSSPMIINQMDSTEEQTKMETQETDSVQEMQIDDKSDDKQINDENDKNTENNPTKSPQISEANSRSESVNSSRCSSPITQDDDNKDKRNRVDDIVNNLNLVAERINSNSSCNSTNGSLNNDKNGITKLNGNCKNRRKLNQPQQCKTTDDDDDLNEINQMNQLDDKDDLYKDDLDDEDCLDDEMNDNYSATGQQQQLDNLRKLANSANLNNANDLEKLKAWETLLQQIQLNQQPQLNPFNSQLNQQFNQQFNNAINQQLNSNNNQLNNSNHSSANLRSTRVSDRGRLNGQMNSNNNSANSTPVNLSINSPKLDDDDYLLNLTKNSDFYDSKDNFNNLSANLSKEFTILIEELQKSICSRKLTNSLQDKLRLRFDQFLNGNDTDLEQFFTNTKEHLISSVVQIIDNNFQRYKTKIYMQNINGSFNSLNQFNQLNQLNNLSNNLNQSSKNLLALNKQPIQQQQQPQRKQERTIAENNTNSNLRTNSTTNLVEQLNNRLQRSSPNLLAGLNNLDNITAANVTANNLATNKLFQNLNSNLNSSLQSNVSSLLGGADFKTPFSNFLQDNNILQLLHAQQEEQLQLQNKLQKENQQDSNSLSLMAPKRKRIKASDEPRRTRTSNRLPNSQNNQINSLTSQINSLNTINQTLNSMTPKTTQEMLNLVSRELNNTTPLHNLNQSTNTSLNSQNNQNDLERDTSSAVNRQSTNNVFPFNNSFINSLNQGDLDVQQLMLAVNNGLNNNNLNNGLNGQVNSNRASPLSSFGNLSSGQYVLDNSPDNSLNNDLDGAESTTTLSPVHLRKAKLMFFYVRYPSSNVLKTYFRDIKFNKNNTAQLVKWFSNFREFYYQQIDKHARQELSNGRQNPEDIHLPADSELLKVLNVHYNRQNHISVPESFRAVVEQTVREFFRSIKEGKDDLESSWRKPIYKIIARLDTTVPECFRQPNFLDALESNNYTEL